MDSYPDEKEPVMLIDIGAKSTDLIYSEQGRFFTRSISAGGIFVTSAHRPGIQRSLHGGGTPEDHQRPRFHEQRTDGGAGPATANLATVTARP